VTLRTLSRVTKVEDFNGIVIATKNGYPVKGKRHWRVEDSGVDPTSAASLTRCPFRVARHPQNSREQNTIAVINAVKQRMAEIQPLLPSRHQD